jgi:hypothetical protein
MWQCSTLQPRIPLKMAIAVETITASTFQHLPPMSKCRHHASTTKRHQRRLCKITRQPRGTHPHRYTLGHQRYRLRQRRPSHPSYQTQGISQAFDSAHPPTTPNRTLDTPTHRDTKAVLRQPLAWPHHTTITGQHASANSYHMWPTHTGCSHPSHRPATHAATTTGIATDFYQRQPGGKPVAQKRHRHFFLHPKPG